MNPGDWAVLIPVVFGAVGSVVAGGRRVLREVYRASYERARSDISREQALATIEAKNHEIALKDAEAARLRARIDSLGRVIENLSGGVPG